MVLVIPICALLTLAQFIYLNLNPVDPLTVGSSSVAAVAAIGVGASALVAHAVHALLGQARRPFNIDSLRTLGSSSNSRKYHTYLRLSFYDPYNPNNTTRLHNVTTLAIDSRQPVQPYAHPSPSVLNTSEWRVPAEPTVELDARPPSPSRALRLHNAKDPGSCPLQQPARNVSVERCPIGISFKLPATRAPSRPESRPLENGSAIDWRVGCLFGLFVGLACGVLIGSALAQRRFVTVGHEPSPLPSTPLPSHWIVDTTDESVALTAVKQYSSVLSAIVDSISKYPAEDEVLDVGSKPVSETRDSTTGDLGTETDDVAGTPEDILAIPSLPTLGTIDPASVPLPEDEPEDILGGTEVFGTVESILDPTLVPLPECDHGAFDEDQTGDFFDFSSPRVDSGSNMSLCTVVGGVGFDLALEGLSGDITEDFQPGDSTTSPLRREGGAHHTVESAHIKCYADCSGHGDVGEDQVNRAMPHFKLIPDLTDMLSVVATGIKEPSEETSSENVELRPAKRRRLLGPETDMDEGGRRPSGDSWESRGSYFDFSDSESEGTDSDSEAELLPDTVYWPADDTIPSSLLDSRTLQFMAPSMRARYSRLEVIEESAEEEGSMAGPAEPSMALVDSGADLDDSLLSADMSLDSNHGLTIARLEFAGSDGADDEFGLPPWLPTSSKSCPGSLVHYLADSSLMGCDFRLECALKRAIPSMVPSSSSPSVLAYSVELPRPTLDPVASTRARSWSHPGSLSTLAARGVLAGHLTRTEHAEPEQQAVGEPGMPEGEAKKKRRRSKASRTGQVRRAGEYARRKAGLSANE